MLNKGKVLFASKNSFDILYENEIYSCKASKKINLDNKILPGDFVMFSLADKFIHSVEPRFNEIIRPSMANVDKVVIVSSIQHPDLSTTFLNKLIHFYTLYQVDIILVFSKTRYLTKKHKEIIKEYQKVGYPVFLYDKYEANSVEDLKKHFGKDNTIILSGSSGVGKSTIAQSITHKWDIKVGDISYKLDRGKHTTTSSTIFPITNGFLCDTPGFSSITVVSDDPIVVANCFKDFADLAAKCKFNNCLHGNEIQCAVKHQVGKNIAKWRYDDYQKILQEILGK